MRKKRNIKSKICIRPTRSVHPSSAPNNSQCNKHANVINKSKPNYNSDMRVICDPEELKQWIKQISYEDVEFGVCQYFIGQKCEQFENDVFMSGDIDLTNFFMCVDSNPNKIHKHNYLSSDEPEDNIGKGIVVKSISEDSSGRRVFILFDDLYRTTYSSSNLIKNAKNILDQFERVTHYPMQGICVKVIDKQLKRKCIEKKVPVIINFKM